MVAVREYGHAAEAKRVLDCCHGTRRRRLMLVDRIYGYDPEACSQALHLGVRVVVADFDLCHNSYPSRIPDPKVFRRADRTWRSE
jgi:hypothetical protein